MLKSKSKRKKVKLKWLRAEFNSLTSVAALFRRLVAGMSVPQFTSLIRCSDTEVLKWDPRARSMVDSYKIPWTVKYLLTQFHVKHIFSDGRLPDTKKLARQIDRWALKRKLCLYMSSVQKFEEKYNDVDFQKC